MYVYVCGFAPDLAQADEGPPDGTFRNFEEPREPAQEGQAGNVQLLGTFGDASSMHMKNLVFISKGIYRS